MAPENQDTIELAEHDPSWADKYHEESSLLRGCLSGLNFELHHIGSTAVPGLAAKPVIDILLAVDDLNREEEVGRRICEIGYVPVPIEDPGRRFFRKGMPRTHHLHLVAAGSWEHFGHLWFRDYLIEHALAAEEYECLKRLLASRCRCDREAYVEGKEAMVSMILKRAVRERLLLPTFYD